jgi:hypothetical protein
MLSVQKSPSLSFDDIPPSYPTKIPKEDSPCLSIPEEESESSTEAEEVSIGNPLLSFLGLGGERGILDRIPFSKHLGNIGREEIIILIILVQ